MLPLEGGDQYGRVYLRDAAAPEPVLLSAGPSGAPANHHSTAALISRDGSLVVFQSYASDLVPGDQNNQPDLFVYRLPSLETDSDQDGLADEWEMTWFGDLAQDKDGDPDHDGASNAAEFRAGTNPGSDASLFQVQKIEAVLSQRMILFWKSVPGKQYQVEAANDFSPDAWQSLNTPVYATSELTSLDIPSPAASQFYRVRLVE
jgi:hypothetical protein